MPRQHLGIIAAYLKDNHRADIANTPSAVSSSSCLTRMGVNGYDPKTGEVVKQIDQALTGPVGHLPLLPGESWKLFRVHLQKSGRYRFHAKTTACGRPFSL